MIGDSSWKDYEYALKATLVEGEAMQIHFRVSENGNTFGRLLASLARGRGFGTHQPARTGYGSGRSTPESRVRLPEGTRIRHPNRCPWTGAEDLRGW